MAIGKCLSLVSMVWPLAVGSVWNSLEVVKLLVGLLTPLVVVFLGLWVNRLAKRLDHAEWTNQKVVEKRLVIYDELAPSLNTVYCYFLRVGSWNEPTPAEIVAHKRNMDTTMYVYRYLFTSAFWDAYQSYIGSCFKMYTGPGHKAQLRTSPDGRTSERWSAGSGELFAPSADRTSPDRVACDYFALMAQFAKELGIGPDGAQQSPKIPAVPGSPRGLVSRNRASLPARRSSGGDTVDLARPDTRVASAEARRPPP
jgi:hypothetical protein